MLQLLSRNGAVVRVGFLDGQQAPSQGRTVSEGSAAPLSAETQRILKQARAVLEKDARRGSAPAQVNLAVLELAGWDRTPNAGPALYWLHEAADQHYALAYFNLGILYQNGCGVNQDYAEAARYFELGVNAGDGPSQTNLAYLYDQGLGVARDRARAAALYGKAAERGEAQAQFNLADLYVRGDGVVQNDVAAFFWFQKAALQDHAAAQIMLASLYAQGRGAAKDLPAAYAWLTLARSHGDPRAESYRDALTPQLTQRQVAEARHLVRSLVQSRKRQSQLAMLH
jgi:TPR repeat protein